MSWITNFLTPEWLTAFGTLGAVLIVLFREAFEGKPNLKISLQVQAGTSKAYWHESASMLPAENSPSPVYSDFAQLRVWVQNNGSKDAMDARVKLSITDPELKGRDSPLEFVLPVFVYYRPRLEGGRLLLAAPGPEEVTVDIAARSREAFELIFHRTGTAECNPYSRTSFPLVPKKRYSLELVAYANDVRPTKPMRLAFEWNGTQEGLSDAIMQG